MFDAFEIEVKKLKAYVAKLEQDLYDCAGAVQTSFVRCECGRLAERGIICPSNQEKSGSCEAGL